MQNTLSRAGSNFFGIVSIGNPRQHFKVIFDTSTKETWVPSMQCWQPVCFTKSVYRFTQSQTMTRKYVSRTR